MLHQTCRLANFLFILFRPNAETPVNAQQLQRVQVSVFFRMHCLQ
jgi:hypothetical protein